jgi:molybdenum cofactor biosynthesis enzyme MoaA
VPTYLRIVATTRCPLSCGYCHAEGDLQRPGASRELPVELLERCLAVAARAGVRKFKFVGGEPLVRRDLPRLVAAARRHAPRADLSVITSGVVGVAPAAAAFAAGLDRMNVSIHGWRPEHLALRRGNPVAHRRRGALLDWLVDGRRPTKLNYVYTGDGDDEDVGALLDWAAARPVVVGLLDNLHDPNASPLALAERLARWRGPWDHARPEPDADSLDTTRLYWRDGLVVELKTTALGVVAPWAACRTCPKRTRCREGILALRLTHDGRLQGCMDRPDLSLTLADAARRGEDEALAQWQRFVTTLRTATRPARLHLPVVQEVTHG